MPQCRVHAVDDAERVCSQFVELDVDELCGVVSLSGTREFAQTTRPQFEL